MPTKPKHKLHPTAREILNELSNYRFGRTTRQLAEKLERNQGTVHQQLLNLATYGFAHAKERNDENQLVWRVRK